MKDEYKKWIKANCEKAVFDEPMHKHTSLKVGGAADAFITPLSLEELKKIALWAKKNNIFYFIIGSGTNIIVKDNGIRGIVISLKFFNKIQKIEKKEDNVTIIAEAGAKLSALCRFAERNGYKGMTFAEGIPGTVGGAIFGNAGTSSGEMKDVVKDITFLNDCGEIETIEKEKINFSYRNSGIKNSFIILSGSFGLEISNSDEIKKENKKIIEIRKKKQPQGVLSAGSFFKNSKNGKSAGELIDKAGLKGLSHKGAQISDKHANFIINKGTAKASDLIELMNKAREIVKEKFNITLETEVKIIGE